MLKFSVDGGIVTIRSTILIPTKYATVTIASKEILKEAEVRHKIFKVALHPNFPDEEVAIGGTLSAKGRTKLCSLLKGNLDIFAWKPSDMTGVPQSVAKHWLNIREGYTPFDELPSKSIDGYKDFKAAFLAYFMQQKKYVIDPMEIHNIKQKDGETIEDFLERFKIETGRKFKPPPPMVTPIEKRHSNMFCKFHNDKGHSTDECVQLRKQIEELRVTRQKVTQSFAHVKEITFPPLTATKGTGGPLVIEAEISGHVVHCVYVDGGSSIEFLMNGGIVTICSTFLTPTECTTITATPKDHAKKAEARHKKFKVAIHPDFPDQAITIGGTEYHDRLPSTDSISEKDIPLSDRKMRAGPGARQGNPSRAPKPKEELIMYLSASYGAVSAVLMTKKDKVQTPVYFVSRALQAPEINYTPIEKLILAQICAAKSVMLGEHNITYRPWTSVKGQILADFLVQKLDDTSPDTLVIKTPQEPWTLFMNRSSCVDGSGAGLILISPEGTEFTYALSFQFIASNNEAEYEALITGPRIAVQMGVRNVHVSVDSKLVENQVLGTYVAKESIQEEEVATVVGEEGPTWMTLIMEYLKDGTLPGDEKKASKLRIKARQYELLEGVLYRRSFLKTWLRKGQVFYSRYGLFHKIDRGKSRGNNHRESGEEVRVGQHSMPLQSPRRNSLRQCPMDSWREQIEAWVKESRPVSSSHGDTPFSLTYRTEAVIPAEIKLPMYRTVVVDAIHNNKELWLNLDLLEERYECVAIREAKEKLKMTKYYNTRVCGITFRPEDFVYRINEACHAMNGGKLNPKWEVPYEVTEALADRAYMLRSMDGAVLPRM
nr:reverse transcriptase domain-containing protein [Tanacetum cinerariifolium]